MQKLSLNAQASNEEVIDSIADAFHIGISIDDALEDGWQLQDLLTFLSLEDEGREIINDVPVFLAEFIKLTPKTAIESVIAARTRVIAQHGQLPALAESIFSVLYNAASSFGFAMDTRDGANIQVANWKTVLAGGSTIPIAS